VLEIGHSIVALRMLELVALEACIKVRGGEDRPIYEEIVEECVESLENGQFGIGILGQIDLLSCTA